MLMPLTYDGDRIVYQCSECGASGCKLWREYSTFLNHQTLFCVACACRDYVKDKQEALSPDDFDADGKRPFNHKYPDGKEICLGRTDQIGWLIPAVPTDEGDTFWGYTSVPEKDVNWWRALPTKERSSRQ